MGVGETYYLSDSHHFKTHFFFGLLLFMIMPIRVRYLS